ncbi:MAG: phage holin family protein [Deltaproteobacteria bacterium]|nr:phage holin family protein [Deltaproteobacteria bacterium]
MITILIRFLIISGGIVGLAYYLPGIEVSAPAPAFMAAFVLGLLNVTIRPVFIFFSFPLRIITLGLFTLVINGTILYVVSLVVPGFEIEGFLFAFIGAIILSLLSAIVNEFVGKKVRKPKRSRARVEYEEYEDEDDYDYYESDDDEEDCDECGKIPRDR